MTQVTINQLIVFYKMRRNKLFLSAVIKEVITQGIKKPSCPMNTINSMDIAVHVQVQIQQLNAIISDLPIPYTAFLPILVSVK